MMSYRNFKVRGKKDMMSEEQQKNIETWKSDPLDQEIYTLATNPNRTTADDVRFNELRDQQRKRDFKISSQPTTSQPELTDTEKQATKYLKFAFGVIQPRKIK